MNKIDTIIWHSAKNISANIMQLPRFVYLYVLLYYFTLLGRSSYPALTSAEHLAHGHNYARGTMSLAWDLILPPDVHIHKNILLNALYVVTYIRNHMAILGYILQ